jgi:predicted RND superfamily exporter protein
MERFAVSLTDLVLRRPRWVIVATLVVAALAASGLRHPGFSNNYRAFFSPDNPDLVAFEDFQARTDADDVLRSFARDDYAVIRFAWFF